jgi:cellulose synthase/poly-beta-1,6-N-acetylglucosamine synthase-like glycosyltransferase
MTGSMLIQILLWLSVGLIVWTYFGYFVVLAILSRLRPQEIIRQDNFPNISFIVTAYNEERRIKSKIENTLALSYPLDKIEIIMVSDGSTDKTNEIISSYATKGITLLVLPTRHGKHFGQHEAVKIAKGDIIVFTDATTFLNEDALEKIVRGFADPRIGCISGQDFVETEKSESAGEGFYIRYEMKLRALESVTANLVGVSGCFFALRKCLCDTWYADLSSDFYLPILAHIRGYRVVLETEAICHYAALSDPEKEFHRKVRTIVNGLAVLYRLKHILNPLRYGVFSLQMLSHKLIRWLVPFLLILMFFLNIPLIGHSRFYSLLFMIQSAFYLLAAFAYIFKSLRNINIFKIPLFFITVNYSILVAWSRFVLGRRFVTWESTKR